NGPGSILFRRVAPALSFPRVPPKFWPRPASPRTPRRLLPGVLQYDRWYSNALKGGTQVERLALSPGELAEALGVTRDTVFKWIRDGDLPAVRIGRRC